MEILTLINSGSEQLKKNNINSHILDAELLLAKTLNRKREELIVSLNQKVKSEEVEKFKTLIDRRSRKEPIAYILEKKEFWSKNFFVNKDTLIPRPETELIVEKLVNICAKKTIKMQDI